MSFVRQVQRAADIYVSKGGKRNRRQQRARMLAFARFVEETKGCKIGIDHIGKKDVIAYWKANRELSERTLYAHWLALKTLFILIDKKDEPPRPKVF